MRSIALRGGSRIPRWAQIADVLRERIADSTLIPGALTDAALAAEFGVSQMTVRQALQELVNEGLLVRQRGRGTSVARPPVRGSLNFPLERYLDEWRLQGRDCRVEILARTLVAAPMTISCQMGVPYGTIVAYIRRRRLVDGRPVALDHRYLPPEIDAQLSDEDLRERPIWTALKRKLSLRLGKANMTLRACQAGADEQALLDLAPDSPVLDRALQIITIDGCVVMAGQTFYHPERFIYVTTFDLQQGSADPKA